MNNHGRNPKIDLPDKRINDLKFEYSRLNDNSYFTILDENFTILFAKCVQYPIKVTAKQPNY